MRGLSADRCVSGAGPIMRPRAQPHIVCSWRLHGPDSCSSATKIPARHSRWQTQNWPGTSFLLLHLPCGRPTACQCTARCSNDGSPERDWLRAARRRQSALLQCFSVARFRSSVVPPCVRLEPRGLFARHSIFFLFIHRSFTPPQASPCTAPAGSCSWLTSSREPSSLSASEPAACPYQCPRAPNLLFRELHRR